jgi:cell wall-associated NlpC family hydrolase
MKRQEKTIALQRKQKKSKKKLYFTGGAIFVLFGIGLFINPYFGGHFVKADGRTYYERMGKKVTGQQFINFSKYDFDSKTGTMLTGFQSLNGGTVYFNPKSGKMEKGLQKIQGNYYYFTSNGTDNAVRAYEAISGSLNSGNTIIESVIKNGSQLVGKSPYDYGGGRTQSDIAANKFDCSSFVAYMYRKSGKDLVYQDAASTTLLAETGTLESWNNKKRGDLLLTPDTDDEDEQHVAIYLGDGFILHDSASTGGVNISRLNQVIDKKVLGNMTWAQLFEPGTVNREI